MKSTLADVGQVFNVKAMAAAGLAPSAIPEGQFGLVDESTNLTVVPSSYATTPAKFRFVSKLGGKVYFSQDAIEKSSILNQAYQEQLEPGDDVNLWEGYPSTCDCTKGVQLNINVDDMRLIQRDGLTWTHRDFVVAVAPEELTCLCDCTGKSTYDNNIMVKLLVEKVNALESPYFSAQIILDGTAIDTYADEAARDSAYDSPVAGNITKIQGTGIEIYDGTDWVLIGDNNNVVTDVDTFIEINKAVNTDADDTNDSLLLGIRLLGAPVPTDVYNDLEVNYVYPRGTKITPSLLINGDKSIVFTEVETVSYPIGDGYDLRALEWESMNHYTNLNYYPRLSDGIQAQNLVYQFENGKFYDTFTFEFDSAKVERAGDADKKRFFVVLASEDSDIITDFQTWFTPA